MPATFLPSGPSSTSFGHFNRAAEPRVRATARPVSNGSQPQLGTGGAGRSNTEKVRPAPAGDTQLRPSRPRPPDCSSATSTGPAGAPVAAAARRSALVGAGSGPPPP